MLTGKIYSSSFYDIGMVSYRREFATAEGERICYLGSKFFPVRVPSQALEINCSQCYVV